MQFTHVIGPEETRIRPGTEPGRIEKTAAEVDVDRMRCCWSQSRHMLDRPRTLRRQTDQEHTVALAFQTQQVRMTPRTEPVVQVAVAREDMFEIQARSKRLDTLGSRSVTERLEPGKYLGRARIVAHRILEDARLKPDQLHRLPNRLAETQPTQCALDGLVRVRQWRWNKARRRDLADRVVAGTLPAVTTRTSHPTTHNRQQHKTQPLEGQPARPEAVGCGIPMPGLHAADLATPPTWPGCRFRNIGT